ncbi:Gag-Pol polyprotein, partial [Mucuna pruriens]
MIGPIEPKASNGHRFILVAVDYFTKWIEAESYASVSRNVVAKFIKRNLICRYGIPADIVTDNGTNLNNKVISELCGEFQIKHRNSTPYRPQMNGAVEAANKNIKKIIQKMVVTYKDWHDMLPYALHGYRSTARTSTGATPYALVYGMEAVLPVEVEIPSLRVIAEADVEEAEWARHRFDQLNLITEKRLRAICHGQLYQRRVKQAFDKKVRPRIFREGDLVLRKILPATKDFRGKWIPKYEGPYVVRQAFLGGALILTDQEGWDLKNPVNADSRASARARASDLSSSAIVVWRSASLRSSLAWSSASESLAEYAFSAAKSPSRPDRIQLLKKKSILGIVGRNLGADGSQGIFSVPKLLRQAGDLCRILDLLGPETVPIRNLRLPGIKSSKGLGMLAHHHVQRRC